MAITNASGTIRGGLSSRRNLKGTLTIPKNGGQSYPEYSGNPDDYVVTPKAFEVQTLSTKGKLMKQDLVVKEIPYSETSNPSDGITIYIGKELE